MKIAIMVLLTLGCLLTGIVRARSAAIAQFKTQGTVTQQKEELGKLQGTWTYVVLQVEGADVPETAYKDSRLIISGDAFTMIGRRQPIAAP